MELAEFGSLVTKFILNFYLKIWGRLLPTQNVVSNDDQKLEFGMQIDD
jgi:hypothetical protein